ncbi:ABC transporter ATP-binding protein [Streptomyces viridochromogenes]|uniref:Putative ABC-type antimicrobial peptide transport system, ATPase component n=1 Tax=Streptomyces viridochromogenes Tue57 TaxID=1160705 RepID=L8PJW1_STRVR|nr:ATP-binding cassette domain-containing protein [Streptomyces viridochromogenes]ELS57836.1 putative ABC-type antimicrobial peptide transport system, ATPase component [Streptomyces viridochromogenes Tue57]
MSNSDTEPAPDPVLHIQDLTYSVRDRTLFKGLRLRVGAGESVAITGPSGSGKSTLLSSILGLIKPHGGSVRVTGADVTKLRGRQLAKLRSETIGTVFQFGELLPELSPLDNVALAALLSRSADRADGYRRAQQLLDELRVPRAGTTEELSGGEHQRTAVARALINSPELILADEPTGSLDPDATARIAELLFELPRRRRCGLVLVTHDVEVAARADRVLRLEAGLLVPARVREAMEA